MGKNIFRNMKQRTNVHYHYRGPDSMTTNRFQGQIHREQNSDYLLWALQQTVTNVSSQF